jgi:hypothetical protein
VLCLRDLPDAFQDQAHLSEGEGPGRAAPITQRKAAVFPTTVDWCSALFYSTNARAFRTCLLRPAPSSLSEPVTRARSEDLPDSLPGRDLRTQRFVTSTAHCTDTRVGHRIHTSHDSRCSLMRPVRGSMTCFTPHGHASTGRQGRFSCSLTITREMMLWPDSSTWRESSRVSESRMNCGRFFKLLTKRAFPLKDANGSANDSQNVSCLSADRLQSNRPKPSSGFWLQDCHAVVMTITPVG